MRTFIVGVVAIAGCAIGNAQTFDFHALTVSGHSRYIPQSGGLKESLQKEGSRSAIPTTLPTSITATGPVSAVPMTDPDPTPQGPPLYGIVLGAAGVLGATAACFRHLLRRQSAMRAV